MLELLRGAAVVAATVTTGLVAGLFYTFSCSIMPGLGRLGDDAFIDAMRRVNAAILNGWFAATFVGAPLLTGVAAALHLAGGAGGALPWAAAALVLHGVTLAVTFTVNVPLNEALDRALKTSDAAHEAESRADSRRVRESFAGRWTRWNVIRALTSAAAFACLAWSLVQYGQGLPPS
ncbi:DUF1772 domain-containing protein [Microbispora sp. NPDC049125]|uniref:anthrone oxygenase family protein n=1 Tax=Microbispora sp. NPDC049125 TaxID=3154929 RepID=UPI0034652339